MLIRKQQSNETIKANNKTPGDKWEETEKEINQKKGRQDKKKKIKNMTFQYNERKFYPQVDENARRHTNNWMQWKQSNF